jgi:hypothetical protein
MKKEFIFVLMLFCLVASACQSAAAVEPSTNNSAALVANPNRPQEVQQQAAVGGARVGEEFTLAENESIWIEKGMFLITLDAVIEDSRCPENAECFWEGNAKVQVSVGEEVFILTLGKLLEGDQNSASLGDGMVLRVVEIEPFPGSEQDSQPYSVTLVVEQETSQPYPYPTAA